MKKNKYVKTIAIAALALLCMGFCSCGGPAVPEALIGDWNCAQEASDEMTDTSFYSLSLKDDGSFTLMNEETGEASLKGSMKGDDTGKLGIVEFKADREGFDPPACWSSLPLEGRLRYKVMDGNTIRLGYTGIWLIFNR